MYGVLSKEKNAIWGTWPTGGLDPGRICRGAPAEDLVLVGFLRILGTPGKSPGFGAPAQNQVLRSQPVRRSV